MCELDGGLSLGITSQCSSGYLTHVIAFVCHLHYSDVTMGEMASQITSLTIVYLTVYFGADQSKHQSFASLAFVRRIQRGLVNYPHKWPITRKMFPFDDVIMICHVAYQLNQITCVIILLLKYSDTQILTPPPPPTHTHTHIDAHTCIFKFAQRLTLKVRLIKKSAGF